MIVAILVIILILAYQYATNSPYMLTSQEARRQIQNNEIDLILDVRTKLERETLGYYPKSVHIQSADLESEMPTRFPNKNLRILAYCNTGQRARMATDKLHSLGYKNSRYISSSYTTLL